MGIARRLSSWSVLVVLLAGALTALPAADAAPTMRASTRPMVSTISADEGPVAGGTRVRLVGRHLSGVTTVRFGGARAEFVVKSARRLVAVSPPHGTGPVRLTVRAPSGRASVTFTYRSPTTPPPPPTVLAVHGVAPVSGGATGGTDVLVSGPGVGAATQISFGGVLGSALRPAGADQVVVRTPAHEPATVDVRVTAPTGTSAPNDAARFTFTRPVECPAAAAVSSFWPEDSPEAGGQVVHVFFDRPLVGVTGVTFGGVPATGLQVLPSGGGVDVTTPAHAQGVVDLQVQSACGTTPVTDRTKFTFRPAPATVTEVSPSEGLAAAGQRLTLTGTGFTGATSVRFGDRDGTDLQVLSATKLQVTTPALAPDTYHPAVVTLAGAGYGASYVVVPPPVVSRVDPDHGPTGGGQRVTVTGHAFAHLDGVRAVLFGGVAGTDVQVSSDTQLTVTAPPHAAGQVDVQVRTAAGTSHADLGYDAFSYETPLDTVGTATPVPGAEVEAVSCATAGSCFAVGHERGVYDSGAGAGLVEHWSAGSWTPVSVPVPESGGRRAEFHDVDCPTATFCAAVGGYVGTNYYQPFVATWDGTTWRTQVVALPAQVAEAVGAQVACTDDARCVARVSGVRLSGTTLDGQVLLTYDAGRWATIQVSTPDPVVLEDVACSAHACTLVGSAKRDVYTPSYPVTIQGAGTSWTTTAVGTPADRAANGSATLFAVACPADGSCLAAGTYGRTSTSGQETLPTPFAASLAAGRWTPRSLASTAVADSATYIYDVACGPSVDDCTLVGSLSGRQALVVRVAAGQVTTTAFSPPNADLVHPYADLDHVVCAAAGHCAAVGWYATAGGLRALYVQLAGGQVTRATQPPAPTDGSTIDELVQGLALDPAGTAVALWQYRTSTTTTGYLVRDLPLG
jgi:hypothetical protein